ncbi:OprO/OprP family phosphate-selective porin [Paludibacteraceae bacterium OttesenSCG-928-F17]|nr:OprO/OprP family phosphate-selective porin [Paludibacteraceae bacterium OttesenSCG-928-F17]
MKKYYILIAIFLATGINAFSQNKDSQNILEKLLWDDNMLNIMIDTRVDFETDIIDNKTEELSFRGQTLKIWIAGEIIPGIRYRVRHRLNRAQGSFPREGYSGATDHAWLAFDIRDKWTITAGKQSVQLGTYEYDYNPADVYLPTMIFNDFDGYKAGVNVAYKFLGQAINLQLVNSDSPQFAADNFARKALTINLLWEGSLFNEIVKTRWGYGAFQHNRDKFYNWLTLGTQLNIGSFTAELDYYLGERNIDYNLSLNDEPLGSRFVQDQSASVNLKYNLGKWRPFIKGVWSKRHDKDFKDDVYNISGIQAVVEYYPFTHPRVKDLRFHVMYGYNNTDYSSGMFSSLNNIDSHTLLIGTRWLFKAK